MDNSNRPFAGASIRRIQSALTSISRIDRDIPRVNPDGIYGETTADAVYVFQKKYLGGGDGRVDFPTWQELLRISAEAEAELSDGAPIFPFNTHLKDGKLVRGDRSSLIMMIKLMMKSIEITYPFMEGIDLSELFDTRLYDAVKEFQALHGLKKSGDIDKQTWNRMAIAYGRSLWAD
jgi:hypothetical protein